MENVVSIDVAEKEWTDFLTDNDAESLIPNESLKSSKDKEDRDEYNEKKKGFDRVCKAISNGIILIDNGIITQVLLRPITGKDNGSVIVDKLVYDKRWTAKDREDIFRGIDTKDAADSLKAQRKLCSKLTGIDELVLQRIDYKDLKITDQISAVFFM